MPGLRLPWTPLHRRWASVGPWPGQGALEQASSLAVLSDDCPAGDRRGPWLGSSQCLSRLPQQCPLQLCRERCGWKGPAIKVASARRGHPESPGPSSKVTPCRAALWPHALVAQAVAHRASRVTSWASSKAQAVALWLHCCRVLDVHLRDCGPVLPSLQGAWVGWAVSGLGSLLPSAAPGGPWALLHSSPCPRPAGLASAQQLRFMGHDCPNALGEFSPRQLPCPPGCGREHRGSSVLSEPVLLSRRALEQDVSRTYSRRTSRFGLSCEQWPAARGCVSRLSSLNACFGC